MARCWSKFGSCRCRWWWCRFVVLYPSSSVMTSVYEFLIFLADAAAIFFLFVDAKLLSDPVEADGEEDIDRADPGASCPFSLPNPSVGSDLAPCVCETCLSNLEADPEAVLRVPPKGTPCKPEPEPEPEPEGN